jgi:4-hydroxy-4-methyl-2-oxoglutarate aldolase
MTPPLIDRLHALDSCAVSDALDSLGLPPAAAGISAISVRQRIAGPAVTVRLGPQRPAGGTIRHLCTAAIAAAAPGDIVVVQHSSGVQCAGWGGVLSAGAQLQGLRGVILDGPARDIDEVIDLDFPVYATGPIARTARGRVYEQDYNCPIAVAGVPVAPGDLVLADSSGVVFLPSERAGEIIGRAERIVARERLMVDALRRGESIADVVGRDYEEMLDRLD